LPQRRGAIPLAHMTPSILALSGIGLLLGFRHAFEPDHLAAVSTLATRQGSLLEACRLGLAWAAGHTASVGLVVLVIMVGGLQLPQRLWPAADLLVALLLIGLGGSVLLRYARGRWHMHQHTHGTGPHLHLHSHVHGPAHEHGHPRGDARRSLGFGLLHGLAGGAAILVLLVAAAPSRTAQLAYFLAFAAGTMIGMLLVSFSLAGIVRLASGRGARWATALHLGSAAASVAVGCALAQKVASAL
jgi:High-affinity nickel-transport protein